MTRCTAEKRHYRRLKLKALKLHYSQLFSDRLLIDFFMISYYQIDCDLRQLLKTSLDKGRAWLLG